MSCKQCETEGAEKPKATPNYFRIATPLKKISPTVSITCLDHVKSNYGPVGTQHKNNDFDPEYDSTSTKYKSILQQVVTKLKAHHNNKVIKEEQTTAHVLLFMDDYLTSSNLEYSEKNANRTCGVQTHIKFFLYPPENLESLSLQTRLEIMILANVKRAETMARKRKTENEKNRNPVTKAKRCEKERQRYANCGGHEKMKDNTRCKDCNEDRCRMFTEQKEVKTVCWVCLKEYLLSLITDPSKSYLTVKDQGDGMVCIGNPMFGVGNSKHSKRRFYFVNVSSTRTPANVPLICMLAYNGVFDRE